MEIIVFFIAHWYLSLFTQSFFHHRYSAHQMFTMSKFWEKFFHTLTYIFQGSSYLSPRTYGMMHRQHHAYADTEKDVHSPKFDGNIFKMMWKTKVVYNKMNQQEETVGDKWKKNLPEKGWFEPIAEGRTMRLLWIVAYTAFYYYYVPSDMLYLWLLLPINAVMGPFHGAIINWFSHKFGYRNYELKDTSVNLWPWDLIMWGEGLHNNHHKYGASASFAQKWWEFDPMIIPIKIFNALGIIRLAKDSKTRAY